MERKKPIKNSLVPVVSQAGLQVLVPLLYQLLDSPHLCNTTNSDLKMEQRADMEDDEEAEREIDWAAGLPPEMICSISQWLPLPDYIKIRAVCSSWASALVGGGQHFPAAKHFPWLGLKFASNGENKPSFLADSLENRCYNLSLIPSVYEGEWIGARDGWLVISHSHSKYVWLLNPITGARFDLPSLYTLPIEQTNIRKVILSPVSSGDAIALIIYGRQSRVAFARPKDKEWTALPAHSADVEILDAVYHRGKFVCLTSQGHLHAFDLNGLSPRLEQHISPLDSSGGCANPLDNVYLVSSPSGDLLRVVEKKVCSDAKIITRSFSSIMKFSPKDSRWAKIEDLGDLSLFLDLYHSVALSARDARGLRRNCIYFAVPEFYAESESNGYYVNDVGVFDVKKGVAEPYIPENFRTIGRWHRIPPIWFMPSLL